MKITNISSVVAAAVAAGSIASAPMAFADDSGVTTQDIGYQGKLANGSVVQGWTVTDLRPSTDVIPYDAHGTLWEATATDEAIQGSVTPIVSNLNARARDGQSYRALFQVATPQGVNPATLAQGEKTTGKVYFDVTGENPDSGVYNAGGHDLLLWLQPAPAPQEAGAATSPVPVRGGQTASAPATPVPSGTAATTPAVAGSPATAVPAGSQGTPLAAGSQGTPLPAGTEGAPLPASVEPALAPAGSQGTPLAAGSQGTPLPAGSQGTPLPANSPATALPTTTTVVPAPPSS